MTPFRSFRHLVDLGCEVLVPLGSSIRTGKGILNPYVLQSIRDRFPEVTLVVDSGISKPSHATQALEMGVDVILLNTAVAKVFALSIEAGRFGLFSGSHGRKKHRKPKHPHH